MRKPTRRSRNIGKTQDGCVKNGKAVILPRISKGDAKFGVEAKCRSDCIIINLFPATLEYSSHISQKTKPSNTINRGAQIGKKMKMNETEVEQKGGKTLQ